MNKRTVSQIPKKGVLLDPKIVVSLVGLVLVAIVGLVFAQVAFTAPASYTLPAQSIPQWSPYAEWRIENPSYDGNPYDVVATVTFTHSGSGETRTTAMFYDGGSSWKFRFSGTQLGEWTFVTRSRDPELNGQTGLIDVTPNPGNHGFVTSFGNKWGWSGTNEAFVPQLVMTAGPHYWYNNGGAVDGQIRTFIDQHGFNGFHMPVFCRWVNLDQPRCDQANSENPDPRTFESLEQFITKVHAAGGVVHLWMWTDDADRGNPNSLPGGINGAVDQRLQRYIAARLGPIPGWTMGYGFDLVEWTNGSDLTRWHDFMQAQMGWDHYLGARSAKNQLTQLSEAMDYAAYEQHKPSYSTYVSTIDQRPSKPAFSEDRFRMRDEGRAKDYNMEETRRGLWQSAMAGGVANIWGNLLGAAGANDALEPSRPYPNPQWIKTYATFFDGRFLIDMSRCNNLTTGMCLKTPSNSHYVFYQENTGAIQLNLSGMAGTLPAVAVDTKNGYAEINIGPLSASSQTWQAPYASDWAIAVGDFRQVEPPPVPPTSEPLPPTAVPPTAVPPTAVPPTAVPPTSEPTLMPTTEPTAVPTEQPPVQPTEPPVEPTAQPPIAPTSEPSPAPPEQPLPPIVNDCTSLTVLWVGRTVPPTADDQPLIDWLQASGHAVLLKTQQEVEATDADQVDVVMISSSISLSRVSDMFRDVPVPVMVWDRSALKPMGLTTNALRTGGFTLTQSLALTGDDHPILAGWLGTVDVLTTSARHYWSIPNPSADVLGISADSRQRALVYAYESGDALSGLTAPARRVVFFNAQGTLMTDAGWELFASAFEWTAGCR